MRPRTRTRLLLLISLAAFATLGGTALAKRVLDPNPANDPSLLRVKLDPNRYDGGGGCVKRNPPGTKALIRWMKRNTKKTWYGTIRCDGGVHGTGRALDWALDARKKRQKRLAMAVINTWLARDSRGRANALARRMGIQLIIYNCRWWQAGDRGWSPYSACSGGRRKADPTQGHIDHIHIELTKRAAKLRTSFWKSDLAGNVGKVVGGGGKGGGGGISPSRAGASSAAATHPPLHPPEASPVTGG